MQEYAAYYGTACLILSMYLLFKGITAALRQRSSAHDAGACLCLWNPGVGSAHLCVGTSAVRFCERIAEVRAPRLPKGCGPMFEDGGACSKFRSSQLDLNEFATPSRLRRSAGEPNRLSRAGLPAL